MRIPAELMHVFLPNVNLEISVDATDHEKAVTLLDTLRVMLYLDGLMPTIAPFATSHSLNEYAGINFRSSSQLAEKLPDGLRQGISAKGSRVEGWPGELNFSVICGDSDNFSRMLSATAFIRAEKNVLKWQEIEAQDVNAVTLRGALAKAALMPDRASSILHIWQSLEAVFGKGPELTFRMSLSLAELCGPIALRTETYSEAKKSYKVRSGITHGKGGIVNDESWLLAWRLLVKTIQSILHRNAIPSEDEIFLALLSR
ncbi:hypothetical protein DDV93_09840 [Cereibacter johrii]|nr:hypothetical protein DDV93_09840 [Cereibacter johrii]